MVTASADGLELPVRWAADGPWLESDGDAAPLAGAANHWLRGPLEAHLDALRRGEEVDDDGHYARRPGELDDVEGEGARWRRLAGSEVGDDAYLVGLDYAPGELLVPRGALISLLERLAALRDGGRPLAAGEVRSLEEQARGLDELTLSAATPEDAARAHIRRGLFLEALTEAGLLSGISPETRAQLDRAGAGRLLGYVDAAAERARYARSEARRAVAEHVGDTPAVSLDWWRLRSPAPPGADPLQWLARWEAIFSSEEPGDGPEGAILIREDGRWHRVEWRRDDGGRPLLLRVEPMD